MYLYIRGLLLLLFVLPVYAHAQPVRKTFAGVNITPSGYDSLLKEAGFRKKLPEGFEKPVLLALTYFPELKHVRIHFRIRKKSSPLMVRPSIASAVFRAAAKRTYIIFISRHSDEIGDSILMKNLPLDAQLGVVGHELTHVSAFLHVGRIGLIKMAAGNLSRKYLDKIEFETDMATVEHGLGWQLLTWSEFVRTKLKLQRWHGTDLYIEGKALRPKTRYMNPETIKAVMAKNPQLYKD